MVLTIPSAKSAIVIVMLALLTASCEKQMLVLVKCSECTTEEPATAQITLRLSEEYVIFNVVTLNIYEGDNTDGQLVISLTGTAGSGRKIDVSLNRTYTLEAIYSINSRTYRVIDSARPQVKYSESDCDEPCYFIYNNTADLRLKYL